MLFEANALHGLKDRTLWFEASQVFELNHDVNKKIEADEIDTVQRIKVR